jgi:hypothetical protein
MFSDQTLSLDYNFLLSPCLKHNWPGGGSSSRFAHKMQTRLIKIKNGRALNAPRAGSQLFFFSPRATTSSIASGANCTREQIWSTFGQISHFDIAQLSDNKEINAARNIKTDGPLLKDKSEVESDMRLRKLFTNNSDGFVRNPINPNLKAHFIYIHMTKCISIARCENEKKQFKINKNGVAH